MKIQIYMIISKTPLSICLFGAETDNKDWYLKNTGISIGFSINKYVYVSAIKKNKPLINNLYIEKTIKYLEKIGINCKNIEINFFYDLENEILNFEHDNPYIKYREHYAIMFRLQELDKIYKELSVINRNMNIN